MVKTSASRTEDPGWESGLRRDFSEVESYSDLKIDTPEAPGVIGSSLGRAGRCQYTVMGEMESWICSFYLSVAARKIV